MNDDVVDVRTEGVSYDAVLAKPRGAASALLQILVSFPIAFFTGALGTDIIYVNSTNILWSDFSDWLLAFAMTFGGVAALLGLIIVIANRRTVTLRSYLPVAVGSALALILGLFDCFVHSRDAWTSVMPLGITLSAIVTVITLITAWIGFAMTPVARLVPAYTGVRR